jgi:hypothetical protein
MSLAVPAVGHEDRRTRSLVVAPNTSVADATRLGRAACTTVYGRLRCLRLRRPGLEKVRRNSLSERPSLRSLGRDEEWARRIAYTRCSATT